MKSTAILSTLLLLTAAGLALAEPDVEIRTTLVAMPEAAVLAKVLRGEFETDAELFAFAKKQIADGKARIEAAPRVVAPSGSRGKFENRREIAVPSEFEFSKSEPRKIVMTEFDLFRCGTLLEVDATVGKTGIAFEHHLSDPSTLKYAVSVLEQPQEASTNTVEQRAFYLAKVFQHLSIMPGGVELAAMVKPLDPRNGDPQCHLLFTHADFEHAKREPAKAGNIDVHVVAFEAPSSAVHGELMRRGNGSLREDAGLLDRMLRRVEEGGAEILTQSRLATLSGQRAKTEMVRLNSYPTKYQFMSPDLALPTAFEMRPSGGVLEVEPILAADHGTIRLILAPELVGSMELHPLRIAALSKGKTGSLAKPQFAVSRLSTECAIDARGGVAMLGTAPSDKPGMQHLWFVRGNAESAKDETAPRQEAREGQVEITSTAFALAASEAAILRLAGPVADEKLHAELVARSENGGAEVLFHGSVLTRIGQRAKILRAREVIGPSEVHYWGREADLAGPGAFEMWNSGFELEVDPSQSKDKEDRIVLNCAVRFQLAPTEFHPMRIDGANPDLAIDKMSQHPLSLITAVEGSPGTPMLASITDIGESSGRTVFLFVQANIRKP